MSRKRYLFWIGWANGNQAKLDSLNDDHYLYYIKRTDH